MKEDVRRGKAVTTTRRDLDSKRKRNCIPKPNRPFKNFIRPFGLISRRYFPLFPLIPRRCRSCFLPLRSTGWKGGGGGGWRVSSLILIQRQFVYRRAGFVGRIFYSPARRTFVVASKFRSGLVNEKERERESGEREKMYGPTLSTTGRSLISNERAARTPVSYRKRR